jgi:DNA-binding NtrC family response regulator
MRATVKTDLLVVDDRERLCTSLLTSFNERGYTGVYALDRQQALAHLFSKEIRVIVLDVKLGDDDGVELLRDIVNFNWNIPVIIITGYATVDMAVDALKVGAVDFLQKPVPFEKLFRAFEKAAATALMVTGGQQAQTRTDQDQRQFMTNNGRMVELLMDASNLAESDLPVLILGESGTGKELIAEFIQHGSSRADQPFVKINCSAFPESLLDNELFGHEKGAFTGADEQYKGVFERANKGSLFLDELGDMPLFLQPKVLRAIQNLEVRRLGGKENLTVDVRFIAATNKDLGKLVDAGAFREDLYYRLNAAQLHVPPLRNRPEDIPLLANVFREQCREMANWPCEFDDDVMALFMSHSWPGNIRELENAVKYSAVVAKGERISIDDLPPYLKPSRQPAIVAASTSDLKTHERRVIERTLERVHYNKKRAAELLNISRVTLYKKIEKYGITGPS